MERSTCPSALETLVICTVKVPALTAAWNARVLLDRETPRAEHHPSAYPGSCLVRRRVRGGGGRESLDTRAAGCKCALAGVPAGLSRPQPLERRPDQGTLLLTAHEARVLVVCTHLRGQLLHVLGRSEDVAGHGVEQVIEPRALGLRSDARERPLLLLVLEGGLRGHRAHPEEDDRVVLLVVLGEIDRTAGFIALLIKIDGPDPVHGLVEVRGHVHDVVPRVHVAEQPQKAALVELHELLRESDLVEGSTLEAQVYIYHADMVDAADEEKLAEVMRESFAERDIIIYSGHAGSNAGFILDYDPKFEIDDEDFKDLPMADKYQIFVLDGCMTYRTYVDQLLANPAKTFENVDIVTTVNTTPFGLGYQVLHEFVYWLTLTDQLGRHYPLTWQTILRGVNIRSFKTVHYGVHGIDNDPQINPHGGEDMLCSPCRDASECGPGGNICLNIGGQGGCGVACSTDVGCPDGYRCARLTDDPDLFHLPKQCIPRDYQCR